MRFALGCALSLASLAALLGWPAETTEGVRAGLETCAEVIIPSLFPFFVLGGAITELGIPQRLSRSLSEPMSRLFGVSGAGASALVIGVLGGYPLGAATAAGLCERGVITRAECERLLGFVNNSGPAFLVGAAGVGLFGSARAGLVLYACHVLAAVTAGLFLRGRGSAPAIPPVPAQAPAPGALARAVTASVRNILNVCGFVVIFSAITAALGAAGIFPRLAGGLASRTGLELGAATALLTGFLEIGGGIGALRGCSPTAANFALCAFIIGWGGLSVHMQTAAATAGAGVKTARHLAGRLMSAAFSAIYAWAAFGLAGL